MKQAGHLFSAGSSSVPGDPLGVAGGPGDPIGRQVCTQPCQQYLLILVHPLVLQGALTVSFLVRPLGTRTPRIITRDGHDGFMDSSLDEACGFILPLSGVCLPVGRTQVPPPASLHTTPSPTGPSAAPGPESLTHGDGACPPARLGGDTVNLPFLRLLRI